MPGVQRDLPPSNEALREREFRLDKNKQRAKDAVREAAAADPIHSEAPRGRSRCGQGAKTVAEESRPEYGDPPMRSCRASPAGTPSDREEFVQADDDRAIFQASPDELPSIELYSL